MGFPHFLGNFLISWEISPKCMEFPQFSGKFPKLKPLGKKGALKFHQKYANFLIGMTTI
jgi:hypothetical protein